MEQNTDVRQKQIEEYKAMVEPLLKYVPWMEQNAGKSGSSSYQGQGIGKNSMSFPVYDANLMRFVKEASGSPLMNRNYSYVYTRNRIKTHDDERRVIAAAELKDWDILGGILSKYVLGGRVKATMWSEALRENIFVSVLRQMEKIIAHWDRTPK